MSTRKRPLRSAQKKADTYPRLMPRARVGLLHDGPIQLFRAEPARHLDDLLFEHREAVQRSSFALRLPNLLPTLYHHLPIASSTSSTSSKASKFCGHLSVMSDAAFQ